MHAGGVSPEPIGDAMSLRTPISIVQSETCGRPFSTNSLSSGRYISISGLCLLPTQSGHGWDTAPVRGGSSKSWSSYAKDNDDHLTVWPLPGSIPVPRANRKRLNQRRRYFAGSYQHFGSMSARKNFVRWIHICLRNSIRLIDLNRGTEATHDEAEMCSPRSNHDRLRARTRAKS